jgi:hypothetical protein
MKLEAQLAELAALGLALEPDVTIDDLLCSFDRAQYEERPFDLVLFALGIEVERQPWGRPVCRRVWNFDAECIEGDGAYVAIVTALGWVAGATHRLSSVADHVDLDAGEGWVEYTLDGKRRHCDVEIQDDWADMQVVTQIMADLVECIAKALLPSRRAPSRSSRGRWGRRATSSKGSDARPASARARTGRGGS